MIISFLPEILLISVMTLCTIVFQMIMTLLLANMVQDIVSHSLCEFNGPEQSRVTYAISRFIAPMDTQVKRSSEWRICTLLPSSSGSKDIISHPSQYWLLEIVTGFGQQADQIELNDNENSGAAWGHGVGHIIRGLLRVWWVSSIFKTSGFV